MLGDALGVARVDGVRGAPGDLVVVEGEARGGALVDAAIVTRHASRHADLGDVRRFVFDGIGRALVARQSALDAVRAYFADERFLEVTTPVRVPSPGLDPHLEGVEASGAYLVTSPEVQMKRLLVGGVPRCFQIGPCFRADERGRLHHPEFTMVEWYRAWAGWQDVLTDTERLVQRVAVAVSGQPRLRAGERELDATPPFERVRVRDAFAEHAGVDADALVELAAHDHDAYFRLMVDVIEPSLAASTRPVFLVDFPASHASLARRCPDDPRFAERFELYAAGVELCNGFGELTDAAEQRARFADDLRVRRARGLAEPPVDERFLRALDEGMPPSAGNALGLDRLLMLAVGARSISDVVAFDPDSL
ncbi:MAG: EF-P lysine aminoacylase GenX [Polyangiaceae bacterium]|nr:EF-P lysine aminoacylase GenX [Polyangiaceae bacterium]